MDDLALTVISTLASIIVGGLITGFVSRYYYQRASKDLEQASRDLIRETENLRQETADVRHYVSAPDQLLRSSQRDYRPPR